MQTDLNKVFNSFVHEQQRNQNMKDFLCKSCTIMYPVGFIKSQDKEEKYEDPYPSEEAQLEEVQL